MDSVAKPGHAHHQVWTHEGRDLVAIPAQVNLIGRKNTTVQVARVDNIIIHLCYHFHAVWFERTRVLTKYSHGKELSSSGQTPPHVSTPEIERLFWAGGISN